MGNEINGLVKFDQFAVDTKKSVLWFDDEPLDLPIKAIELLTVLVRRPGEIVSKERLLDEVWRDSFVEENVLSRNIYRLRKQFRDLGIEEDLIQTIPRRGYRFIGSIEETDIESISIEHELIERTYGFESNPALTDNVVPAPQSSSASGIRSRIFLAGGILAAVVIVAGAAYWYQNGSDPTDERAGTVAAGIEFARMTESGRAIEPAISRDNKNIAYVKSENNASSIVLKNISSQSVTTVVGPKPHELRSLNFSAEGDYLFYIAREADSPDSTVYQVPLFGGTERKILTGVRHFVSLSPKGDRLAFVRHDPKQNVYHLVTAKTDGTAETIVSTRKPPDFYHDWDTYPTWSPDETRVVMAAHSQPTKNGTGKSRSYFVEIDLKTGKETTLKHPNWTTVGNAFWLRDGSGLIVSAKEKVEGFSQLWHLSYPSGEATRITNDTNDYRDFKLSHDSKSIITAEISSSSDLYLVSLTEPDQVERLTSQNSANYGRWGLDWSSDGEELIYVKNKARSDGDLWKFNIESEKEQQLTFYKDASILRPRSAADGNIYFSTNNTGNWHIWKMRPDGTEQSQITSGDTGENYHDLSSDGSYLFYSTPGRGSTQLWRVLLPAGKPELIKDAAPGVVAVSPTDPNNLVSIYYDQDKKFGNPWTFVLQFADRPGEKQDLRFEAENHEVAWDIAGTGVYFGKKSMNRNDVWFQPIDGSPARRITEFEDGKVISVSVSPDGNTLAVSRETTTGNVFMITGI